MQRRLLQAAVILVAATCTTVPILEFIGHRHHSFLSGHDTIVSLATVALCFAVTVPVVRAVLAGKGKLHSVLMPPVSVSRLAVARFAERPVLPSATPPPLRI